MAPRELTLHHNELVHPQMIGGALTWAPGHGLDDLADRLKWGDETKGWAGDSRLTLARRGHGRSQVWELWRLESNNKYSLVCKSRPGLPFPHNLIERLVEHDTRRGFDVKKYVDDHNKSVEQNAPGRNKAQEAAAKLYWALRRDTGKSTAPLLVTKAVS